VRKALLAAVAAAGILLSASPASAVPGISRQTVVFLVHDVPFERFMGVQEFQALARAGGAALMTTLTAPGDRGPGAYVTLGAGARSSSHEASIRVVGNTPFLVSDIARLVNENRDRSTPGLLGSVLRQQPISNPAFACASGVDAILVAMDRSGRVTSAHGGTGVCPVTVLDVPPGSPAAVGAKVREIVTQHGAEIPTLVVVLEAEPSAQMRHTGDELAPVVMAQGTASELFDASGPMHTLTSDTTRRDGVVSNEDVAPTILNFFGIPVPSEMNGSPIRVVDHAPPFALHQKHLEQRRLTVPIQVAVGLAVTILGLLALFVLWLKPRLPDVVARIAPAFMLAILPLGVASLAAGALPHITYAWVILFLIAVPVVAGLLALTLRDRGALVPPLAIGAAVLAFYVVEALRGWPDTLTTLSGGAALDGFRFYGMGNVEIGKILGASLWVAAFLSPFAGFALLVAAGLFCGFPDLGANFGACITLFAAAGLWLPLRSKGRLAWRDLLFVAGVVVGGLLVVIGANLIWSHAPTHGARFVRNGPHGGLFHFVAERLGTGVRQLVDSPLLWITTLGLLPELYFVLRPTPVLKDAFARYPAWRDAVLVLVLASFVALVANDSGAAAASWGFGVAVASIFYLPLVEETWRTPGNPAPATAPEPAAARHN
jgi:hypothetical protein